MAAAKQGSTVEKAAADSLPDRLPPAVAEMVADLRSIAEESNSENAGQVSLDIMERILTAGSLEEAGQGTTDIVEIYGEPLTITLKSWQKSNIGELGVFAVIECVTDDGRTHIVTCGGRNVVAILYRAMKEERFPLRGKFRDVPTNQGYTTLWLDILPA